MAATGRLIAYGSAGTGMPVRLTVEKFRRVAGFDGTSVPYRGAREILEATRCAAP